MVFTSLFLADQACYCAIVVQGHGSFGAFTCEAPELVRYEDITGDEYFVSEREGTSLCGGSAL